MLKQIVEWLENKRIFCRKRKNNNQRALGMLLYRAGLSYRKAGEITKVSHEAIRRWYQKGIKLSENVPVRKRKRIAIDEKEIKINGKKVYLWAVVDVDNEEVNCSNGKQVEGVTLILYVFSGRVSGSARESCLMFL